MKMAQALAESFAASSRNTSWLQNQFSSYIMVSDDSSVCGCSHYILKTWGKPKVLYKKTHKNTSNNLIKQKVDIRLYDSTHVCSISLMNPFWCPESSRTWCFLTCSRSTQSKRHKTQVKCDCPSLVVSL